MLPHLIVSYAYLIVLFGTFFEGEVVLAIAGFAARNHHLHLPLIMLCGFIGGLLGDQFFFWVGRLKGRQYLEKRPHWQENADRVHELLHKYKYWVMAGFRFIYGFRVITPMVIGMSSIPYKEFTFFNIAGAATWSIIVTGLGYIFGNALELFIKNVRHYEIQAVIFIALVCAALWVWSYVKRQMRYKKKEGIIEISTKP